MSIENYKREQRLTREIEALVKRTEPNRRLVREIDAVIKRSGESPEIVFWALRGAIVGLLSEVSADVRVKFAAELQRGVGDMLDVADRLASHKKKV